MGEIIDLFGDAFIFMLWFGLAVIIFALIFGPLFEAVENAAKRNDAYRASLPPEYQIPPFAPETIATMKRWSQRAINVIAIVMMLVMLYVLSTR